MVLTSCDIGEYGRLAGVGVRAGAINCIVNFNGEHAPEVGQANKVLFDLFSDHVIALGKDVAKCDDSEKFLIQTDFLPSINPQCITMNLGRIASMIAKKLDERMAAIAVAHAATHEDSPRMVAVC